MIRLIYQMLITEKEVELSQLMKQVKNSLASDDVEVKQTECIELKEWLKQGNW